MSPCAASTRTSSSEACTSHSTIRSSRFFFTDETVTFRVDASRLLNREYDKSIDTSYNETLSSSVGCSRVLQRTEAQKGKQKRLPSSCQESHHTKWTACSRSVLYDGPSMYERALSLDDCIALLSISTRFVFDKIRDRAVREISAHVPPEWLMPAYVELCTRPIPLSKKEVEELGPTTAARLARAREDLMGTRGEAPYRTGLSAIANAPLGACGCRSCRQARRESAISSALNNSTTVATIIERAMSLSIS